MSFNIWSQKDTGYVPLKEPDEPIELRPRARTPSWRRHFLPLFIYFAIALLSSGISYTVGVKKGAYDARMDWLTPVGLVDHTFHYRRNFAGEPVNETEHTWDVMFPRGRGFVQHPVISPEPMGLAVYHQLHCLDAIRRGYYAARSGKPANNHTAPGHVRHCIDYLRQALLCNADTNLEPIDPVLGGVVGFNVSRKCRDPVKLLHWADKWRTHNQTSIL